MGHYSDCFDAEREEAKEKEKLHLDDEIKKKWDKLDNDEKKFVLLAIDSIDILKGFSSFLEKARKF